MLVIFEQTIILILTQHLQQGSQNTFPLTRAYQSQVDIFAYDEYSLL